MEENLTVCGQTYRIVRLLGHGKDGRAYVLKQIHHEPCSYYAFGDKIEAERRDYERLRAAGVRIPEMLAIDPESERIVKDYIEGETVFEIVKSGRSAEPYMEDVREMAARAKAANRQQPPAVVRRAARSSSLPRPW